jgi:hypothetical protein
MMLVGRSGPGLRLADEAAEELLLPILDIIGIGRVGGEGEVRRRLHPPEGIDQQRVFRLRLIDEDIDADPLGVHCVQRGERLGQHLAIERRALADFLERLIVEHHHHDAFVLADPRRRRDEAHVVERAFSVVGERDGPAIARESQAEQQEEDRADEADRADLPQRPLHPRLPRGRPNRFWLHERPPAAGKPDSRVQVSVLPGQVHR